MVIQNSINQALGLGALAARLWQDTPEGKKVTEIRGLKQDIKTNEKMQEAANEAADAVDPAVAEKGIKNMEKSMAKEIKLKNQLAQKDPSEETLTAAVRAEQAYKQYKEDVYGKKAKQAAAESQSRQTADLTNKSFGDSLNITNITREDFNKRIGGMQV